MAKTIHYSVSREDPNVYHTHTDCEEYRKIESKNRKSRELCQVCAKKG
jgi:hypothetical protein